MASFSDQRRCLIFRLLAIISTVPATNIEPPTELETIIIINLLIPILIMGVHQNLNNSQLFTPERPIILA